MSEWDEVQVGDLCHIKHGYAFKGEHFEDEGHSLLLTPGNFLVGGGLQIRDGKETFYSGEFPDEYLLEEGDLVVAMTDLKQNAPILGSTLRIPEPGRFLHNQRLGLVQDVANSTDRDFLYYLLNDQSVRWWLRATATGSTVRHTAPERIYQAKVRLPPKSIQQTIGASLRAFDDLIENNRRRIEILEEMARLLYREWFVHFRFPGHEDVELVDSDLGPIPEGWGVSQVCDVLETIGGGTPSKEVEEYWTEGNVQWFTPTDLTRAGSAFAFHSKLGITELGLKKSSAKLFPPGSVMMTSRATIGVVSISTTEATTNQGFITCVPSERLPSSYIYFWLHENIDQFLSLSGGATFKELRKSTFRELPILVPSRPEMNRFEECVGPMMTLIKNLLQQNRALLEARDLLLPRLVSGELDVSELDFCLERVGA